MYKETHRGSRSGLIIHHQQFKTTDRTAVLYGYDDIGAGYASDLNKGISSKAKTMLQS